jgi:pimeloyl-ACP methyl ester carboxylesterase
MGMTIVTAVLLALLLLFGCQRRMIYMPRGYAPSYAVGLPRGTVELEAVTRAGRQISFYVPPGGGSDAAPDRVWVIQGGNAARGLDYLDVVQACPDDRAGFLLFDYPGYGLCDGRPTRASITDATEAAIDTLANHLGMQRADLESRLGLLGQSLGCAAALEFAAEHPVDRIVLLSPFTTLVDMAKRVVGWPLCHLALDKYDNRTRLAEIAAQPDRPSVTIIHGDADEIAPVRMSRELAAAHPDWITYVEIRGADHNWLLGIAQREIFDAMTAP